MLVVVSVADPSIPGDPHSREPLLYEATMPGLDEELFFRGLVLALLKEVFPKKWIVLGAPMGWPVAVITLLFTWLHVLHVGPDLRPHAETAILPMVSLLGFGFLVAWIRERTGSVWWAVFAHNVANVALVLLARFGLVH